MEQNIYKYEVVLNLLVSKENHLRAIAKNLNANHMTIKRALDNLVRESILDIKQEGRNNVFSIKKSLEAKNIVLMSELYKLNMLINRHPELKQDINELKKINADIILVFGSYAKGNESEKSDIDIYIDTTNTKIINKVSSINKKFSVKIGKYDKNNPLIKEIEKYHVVIKGVELFYEKNKFFDQII